LAFNAIVNKEDTIETIVEDIADESNNDDEDKEVSHEIFLEKFEWLYSKCIRVRRKSNY
jgi:hypothetical protein